MKRTSFLTVIFVLISVVAITALASCAVVRDGDDFPDFYRQWQSFIDDDALVKQVAIPGSHDAGTVGMIAQASTQGSDVAAQLDAGVRYFDLRVTASGDDLKIYHSIVKGESFLPIARALNDFLRRYPSEFLIVDFQHFGNDCQRQVAEAIDASGLGELALKRDSQIDDLTYIDGLRVGDVRGKAILLWGDNSELIQDYLFRRNNDAGTLDHCVLDSYYNSDLQKKKSEDFIAEALPAYFERSISKNKGLFVLQGQLTASNIFKSLYDLELTHSENMTSYVLSLQQNERYLQAVNIVMRDFIDDDKSKIDSILQLNLAKKIVNDVERIYESNCGYKAIL